jgi:hypothetical protein
VQNLRALAETYREHGLVVVGVHTPEFPFEHDIENGRRAFKEIGITYPVVVDNDYEIWEAFDNHCWLALYLIDAEGRVRRQQFGDYEEAERFIQQLLTEVGVEGFAHGLSKVDAQGAEVATDWKHLASGKRILATSAPMASPRPVAQWWASRRVDRRAKVGRAECDPSSRRVQARPASL